jgi:hypothetical protein
VAEAPSWERLSHQEELVAEVGEAPSWERFSHQEELVAEAPSWERLSHQEELVGEAFIETIPDCDDNVAQYVRATNTSDPRARFRISG